MGKCGSNKKNSHLSKSNTANQKDPNGPIQQKDRASRGRINKCWITVEDIICDVMDDTAIRSTIFWEEKEKILKETNRRLHDSLFLLNKLRNLIEPSIRENAGVKFALQEVESYLKLSKRAVPDQDCINNTNGLERQVRVKKEELQYLKEQLIHNHALGDLKKQSLMEARTSFIVSRMLTNVGSSCTVMISSMNHANPVPGYLVQKEEKKLMLNFHPSPGSHNSEMIHQEEPVEEVNLTLAFVGERLEKLTLEMPKIGQNNDASLEPVNVEELDNLSYDVPDPTEGTSNAIANETNTMIEFYENSKVSSTFRTYNVDKGRVDSIAEIFKKYPYMDEGFRVGHWYFQKFCVNTVAEIYSVLVSNMIISEQDITLYEILVTDMELTGLDLSWLKPMLAKAREMSEDHVEKTLQADIDMAEEARQKAEEARQKAEEARQKAEEAKLKLAELQKKRRLQ